MRILILVGPEARRTLDINTATKDVIRASELYNNQMPTSDKDGVVFLDCGKEPDWSWAQDGEAWVVGDCDAGRHHIDKYIPLNTDFTMAIHDGLEAVYNAEVEEDANPEVARD